MDKRLSAAFALIEKETVSIDMAANHLGCTRREVHALIEAKELEARTFRLELCIVSESLDSYARSRVARVK